MNELTLKLKNEVIDRLTKNQQNINDDYLIRNNVTYSRKQLATEIENETSLGIEFLTNFIMLSIDLIARQKEF